LRCGVCCVEVRDVHRNNEVADRLYLYWSHEGPDLTPVSTTRRLPWQS